MKWMFEKAIWRGKTAWLGQALAMSLAFLLTVSQPMIVQAHAQENRSDAGIDANASADTDVDAREDGRSYVSRLLSAMTGDHAGTSDEGQSHGAVQSGESRPAGLTEVAPPASLACASAVLMEATTGRLLYEQNATEALPPASVTKIMTLLLVMEAIDAGTLTWDSMVTASAHAASMGGSQIFLKEGEQMSVRDMVKSVVIASANDAALALAEAVAGSEEAFVRRMNQRAVELGMENTHFENTNGLDDTSKNHVISARDIAIMSRALIAHKEILSFSSTWMDTVRNGSFGLTNTNRLVRFYKGCTGLKTGSTAKAGFCISVTAERDGMSLICVIMGAVNRDTRNQAAAALLDWGFANYGVYTCPAGTPDPVRVSGGVMPQVPVAYPAFTCVLPRADIAAVEMQVHVPEALAAPIRTGQVVGNVSFSCRGESLGEVNISATEACEKISFGGVFKRILARFLLV